MSENLEKKYIGSFGDADLPDLYQQLYGGCDTFIDVLTEWVQLKSRIELTDLGSLDFYFELKTGLRSATKKLSFPMK